MLQIKMLFLNLLYIYKITKNMHLEYSNKYNTNMIRF